MSKKRMSMLYFIGVVIGFLVVFIFQNFQYLFSRDIDILSFKNKESMAELYKKHKTEIKKLEEYYYRIEDWDFEKIEYYAISNQREIIYLCEIADGYNSRTYVIENEFPVKKFLQFSLNYADLSGDYNQTIKILIKGDQWMEKKGFRDNRIIEIELYSRTEGTASFVFQPNGILQSGDCDEISPLGEGWYSSIVSWEVMY